MDHISQILRGPEDNEYELMLGTSRAENAQVFVQFRLLARGEPDTTAAAVADTQFARQLADYQDKKAFLETQLKELRQKVEVGIAPGAEVSKLELELRSVQRRIEELNSRLAKGSARTTRSASSGTRQMVIDTSFTMDVGETVVVGTSRLKGGTRALIALLTAVPPRAGQKE
jgi:septal ring factor EnvC (AmiA/AmiB activator)